MAASYDLTALQISVIPRPRVLSLPAGKELLFTDAVLSIGNGGDRRVLDLAPRLTVRQEEASLCVGSDALLAQVPAAGLAPGEMVEWGLYDVLQALDRGFASKIHFFGPKAALNWKFHLEVMASGREEGSAEPSQAPAFRATFHWHPVEGASGGIDLELDA